MEFLFKTADWILLALILLLDSTAATEDGVLLKDSDYQRITSNTLKWFTPSPPGFIPPDAVIGSVEYTYRGADEMSVTNRSQLNEQKIYICRAFFEGIWVPGALFEHTKRCLVTAVNKIQEAEHYDVLINIDQGGRIVWEDWERQRQVPRGAVFAGEYYVAHTPSPELRILSENVAIGMVYRVGKIDPNEGIFGKLSVVDERKALVNDVPNGQVLVEIQPAFYELTITSFTHAREKILNSRALKLGEAILRNDETAEMKVESVITYQWDYESSWGQGKAMSKALETRIQFRNSTDIETVEWGLPYKTTKDCIVNIQKILPPGTASHVEVTALFQEKEVPYTGTVLSVFSDHNTMNRTIHGIWKHTEITNITILYGPLYFSHNHSLVPTTTTTTTETPSTTISTTISSTVKSITSESPTKDDQNNIINEDDDDESDAMQLEKKDANTNGGSLRLSSFRLLLPMFIVSSFCYVSAW